MTELKLLGKQGVPNKVWWWLSCRYNSVYWVNFACRPWKAGAFRIKSMHTAVELKKRKSKRDSEEKQKGMSLSTCHMKAETVTLSILKTKESPNKYPRKTRSSIEEAVISENLLEMYWPKKLDNPTAKEI